MKFSDRIFLLLFFLFLSGASAFGQITNDSTKLLYGPKTTRVIHQERYLRGNYGPVLIDTTIHAFYSPLFWVPEDTVFQQNLGNIGTATKPIVFQSPRRIGVHLGRNVFDYYAYKPENISYIDTRSPYTLLHYIQGTRGENLLEAEFSRNIKEWWTAGISYRRITADKQIGTTQSRDGQIESNAVKVYSHVQSVNNRYHLFANFTHLNHAFVESGGILPQESDQLEDLFDFTSEAINLRRATGREVRHTYHIGQTFALGGEDLKLFYNLDHRRQFNRFDDQQLSYFDKERKDVAFHPDVINYDSARTYDKSQYNETENTSGITGNRKHYFYKAYLKHRYAKVTLLTPETQKFNQVFVGGDLEGKVNDKIWAAVSAEYKPTDEYFAQATVKFLFLGGRYERTLYSPDLMQQTYYGNHYSWKNNFRNINASRTAIWVEGDWFNNALKLEVATTTLRDFVFYNETQQPEQFYPLQRLNTVTLHHHLHWGKFNWRNLIVYTDDNDAPKIRVPDFAANSRIYYEGFIFKKALFGQIGLEATYRSTYFGDAYSPALQQFYLQNAFRLADYPVVDAFVAADIKSMNIFVKFSHVNEGLNGPGYFTTPFYPGFRRSFVFGVKWFFFD